MYAIDYVLSVVIQSDLMLNSELDNMWTDHVCY